MTEGPDRTIEFLKSFANLDDSRQVLYPLEEILLLWLNRSGLPKNQG